MASPADSLRASAVATESIVLLSVATIAVLAESALQLGGAYPLKSVAGVAAVALLTLPQLRRHHPFNQFGSANQVTAVRAGLLALLVALIGEPIVPRTAAAAAVIGLLATLLDGVDGWMARRTGMSSAFGARFDMEVDSALILALAILVWQHGKAGPWVILSGLLRYLFVAAGWIWTWMTRPLRPTFRGKTICVVQIAALVLALLPIIEPSATAAIAAIGLLALSVSFLIDTIWLWRHADA